jgi:hypothetical protein
MTFWCLDEISVSLLCDPHSRWPNHFVVEDKQVFPSLEFIGWYTVAPIPTSRHIALHEQACQLFLSSHF